MIGMFGFSLSLSIPFVLFALFPNWINSLPKSGGWLNSIKVILGLLEIAFAFYYLSKADLIDGTAFLTREMFIAIWIMIFACLTLYLLGFIKFSHDSEVKYLSVSRFSLAVVTGIYTIYMIPGLWGGPVSLMFGMPPDVMFSESPNGVGNSYYQDNEDEIMSEIKELKLLISQANISVDNLSLEEITERVFKKCYASYQLKSKEIAKQTYPVIKDVFEKQSATYENILIPFTDGIKTLQVVTNLKEANDSKGENIAESIEKSVTLAIIDDVWKEHLREMDELKQSVQNAVYEQKDPLLIYKFESFNLFKSLIDKINKEIVSFLLKSGLPKQTSAQEEKHQLQSNLQTSRPEENTTQQNTNKPQQAQQKTQPISVEKETGRNEKVTITNGTETRELKWKKAKPLVENEGWRRV